MMGKTTNFSHLEIQYCLKSFSNKIDFEQFANEALFWISE